MTGGMRLSQVVIAAALFSSKWLRRSMRLFSVSTKVMARAARRGEHEREALRVVAAPRWWCCGLF